MIINKSWCKNAAWFSYIFNIFFWHFIRFPRMSSLKYFMYFLANINTKQIWNYSSRKFFAPLRILYPFVKSLLSPLVGIASTFFDSSYKSFSTSPCFILFKLRFLFIFSSLSSNSIFFYEIRSIIFACQIRLCYSCRKISDVNLLTSWVVIYLLWS